MNNKVTLYKKVLQKQFIKTHKYYSQIETHKNKSQKETHKNNSQKETHKNLDKIRLILESLKVTKQ